MRPDSKHSGSFPPRGLFQHLLDRLAARAEPPPPAAPLEPRLAARLAETAPRFSVPSAAAYDDADVSTSALEAESGPDDAMAPTARPEPPLADRAAALREKILTARSREEVKNLRRIGARLLHPDLSPAHERAAAEKIMAELNAAIDAALRGARRRP